MADVRSTPLVYARFATPAAATVLTCPDGLTLLLKRVAIANWGATNSNVLVSLTHPGTLGMSLLNEQLTANQSVDIDTWHALLPGDSIAISSSASSVDLWLSGAALYGTPVGFTPGVHP